MLTSRTHLQELVRVNNPIAVVLLEARRQVFSRRDVDRLIGRRWNFDYVPSIRKSGGLIMLWLDDLIKEKSSSASPPLISPSQPRGKSSNLVAMLPNDSPHSRPHELFKEVGSSCSESKRFSASDAETESDSSEKSVGSRNSASSANSASSQSRTQGVRENAAENFSSSQVQIDVAEVDKAGYDVVRRG
ncbi:hypothetical protein KSP40_PGU017715 [Platanthera guangdongensis]|uniref:Uncharacterized protein n=1 Tax=Platanthera guangdongensis TaxID=2320717 RepID=A0ABR2LY39_9ASPA